MDQTKSPQPVDPMKHFAKHCALVKLVALQIMHGRGNTLALVLRAAGSAMGFVVLVCLAKGWL